MKQFTMLDTGRAIQTHPFDGEEVPMEVQEGLDEFRASTDSTSVLLHDVNGAWVIVPGSRVESVHFLPEVDSNNG